MKRGIRGTAQEEGFGKIKQMLSSTFCKNKENIATTIASTTGLEITLWQKQDDGKTQPIAYRSRYLKETEKEFSSDELELLAVIWGLDKFRFYREKSSSLYRPPSTRIIDKENPKQ